MTVAIVVYTTAASINSQITVLKAETAPVPRSCWRVLVTETVNVIPPDQLSKIQGSDEVVLGDGVCGSDIYQSIDCGFEFREDAHYGNG